MRCISSKVKSLFSSGCWLHVVELVIWGMVMAMGLFLLKCFASMVHVSLSVGGLLFLESDIGLVVNFPVIDLNVFQTFDIGVVLCS